MPRDMRTKGRPTSRPRSGGPSTRVSTRPDIKKGAVARVRAARAKRSPRSMRRMTIVGALVVFLAVLITPTLHSYLQGRSTINDLNRQITAQRADVAAKQALRTKWQDPKYIEQQAATRLGFAMPGSTLTVYVDKNNVAHDASTTGNDVSVKRPWYGKIWQSTVNADKHPATQ
ncbi:FtsB family cell division protein [Leekyejoonella antrihumi]|uniref:Septum formation initiator family protein n=1 Tax=Leekyejoonella antrihumi TaxID=1660198 RepID=A0A563DTH4_9MICO|nr:septum formation initiator family protein [Leekyejoonella antrihumi]TWP33469.1 septum formation initiator family protein [Leekyejoonella antrihumi]